jgi:hypothetical protein
MKALAPMKAIHRIPVAIQSAMQTSMMTIKTHHAIKPALAVLNDSLKRFFSFASSFVPVISANTFPSFPPPPVSRLFPFLAMWHDNTATVPLFSICSTDSTPFNNRLFF